MIYKVITKQVCDKPKYWDRQLNPALWAYRTSFKTSLGFTPFHLVYGQEALLPIDVKLASLRVLANTKDGKLVAKWEGPFLMEKNFTNGSY